MLERSAQLILTTAHEKSEGRSEEKRLLLLYVVLYPACISHRPPGIAVLEDGEFLLGLLIELASVLLCSGVGSIEVMLFPPPLLCSPGACRRRHSWAAGAGVSPCSPAGA